MVLILQRNLAPALKFEVITWITGLLFSTMEYDTSELFCCLARDCGRDEKWCKRINLFCTILKIVMKALVGFWSFLACILKSKLLCTQLRPKARGEISNWAATLYCTCALRKQQFGSRVQIMQVKFPAKNTLTPMSRHSTAIEPGQTGTRKNRQVEFERRAEEQKQREFVYTRSHIKH